MIDFVCEREMLRGAVPGIVAKVKQGFRYVCMAPLAISKRALPHLCKRILCTLFLRTPRFQECDHIFDGLLAFVHPAFSRLVRLQKWHLIQLAHNVFGAFGNAAVRQHATNGLLICRCRNAQPLGSVTSLRNLPTVAPRIPTNG